MAAKRPNLFVAGDRVRHFLTERRGVVVKVREGHPTVLRVRFEGAEADYIANPLELERDDDGS